jgi:Signal transduction histidine kinase
MFRKHFKLIFIIVGGAIVALSTLFSNRLANKLAEEEEKKIQIWAEATRQLVILEDDTFINFMLSIIEGNTTIPVIIVDENDEVIQSRNIEEPKNNPKKFYDKLLTRLKSKRQGIEIKFDDNYSHYLYYDDSLLLKQLYFFPYIQLSVIMAFLLIVFFALSSTWRAEQNKVWVGLSKETAHQLGTPISSLLAWVDLLRDRHSDETLIDEMEKDVNRLRTIAERFSKVGSAPDLQMENLNDTLTNAISYISKRSSSQVEISCEFDSKEPIFLKFNIPLFEWVIENLCKNAIDAMNGTGKIDISVKENENNVFIDIKDTGKGIERKKFKTIFTPGYTTKKRGWGLGLSLTKRIIEQYHRGKIFVKSSEINVGTTFRIVLKKQE